MKSKRIRILFTLVVIFLSNTAFPLSEEDYLQTRDSLQTALDQSTGRERVDALFELIRFIVPFETDTCETLIKEEFELAEQLDYEIGMAKAHQNRGDFYYHTDRHMQALENYFNAVGVFEAWDYYKEAGDTYTRIVIIFYFNANPDKFVLYNTKAIDCFEKCQCWGDLATSHLMFGYYYNNYNVQPDLSKYHHRTALALYRNSKAPPLYLAGTFVSLALACHNAKQLDSSIYYLRKSFYYAQGNNDDEKLQRIIAWRDLGSDFYFLKSYDSAMYYFKRSIQEAQDQSYIYLNISNDLNMASIAKSYESYDEALQHYENSLENALEIIKTGSFYKDPAKKYASDWMVDSWPGYLKIFSTGAKKYWAKKMLPGIYKNISRLYKGENDPAKALDYYEKYHAWSDTMNRINRARELLSMELDRETEIKDRKIEDLTNDLQFREIQVKQSRIILFGSLGLVMLGSVILILLFRQSKLKDGHEKILLQQKLLRSQINPHFIFNSLSSIQHLVISDEPEQASIYLAEFSSLVRSILSTTLSETITYENEIKIIRSYLELQKLRYSNKFDYSIETDHMIDTESLTLPSMLAQPFIENAIEHGFRHKEGHGHVYIRFNLIGDKVIFEIEDDGIGRQKAIEILYKQNLSHQSLSTNLIRERIKVLNRGKKYKITLDIVDLTDGEENARGTLVRFGIPL